MSVFLTPYINVDPEVSHFYIEMLGIDNISYERCDFLNYTDNLEIILNENNYVLLKRNDFNEKYIFKFISENVLSPKLQMLISMIDSNNNIIKSNFLDYIFDVKTHKFKYKIINRQITQPFINKIKQLVTPCNTNNNLYDSNYTIDHNSEHNKEILALKEQLRKLESLQPVVQTQPVVQNKIKRKPFGMRFM